MTDIEYKVIKPIPPLADFVESFWMLSNRSEEEKEIIIVPDGRIDLSYTSHQPRHVVLLGPEDKFSQARLVPNVTMFAISFKLLASEYIFNGEFPTRLNSSCALPDDYLEMTATDLNDFDLFCNKATTQLIQRLTKVVDERKRKLFELIYSSHGSMTVKEMSDVVNWNSRQINRYFNQQFGISLKAYGNILRFRASFQQIKEGKFFPENNFTDQAHFIKEVKKYAGVTPKELNKNNNDRFIQFSVLPKK